VAIPRSRVRAVLSASVSSRSLSETSIEGSDGVIYKNQHDEVVTVRSLSPDLASRYTRGERERALRQGERQGGDDSMTEHLPAGNVLDAYRFHERDWADDEALRDAFEWVIPDEFNVATYVCDRWVGSGRTALRVDDDGTVTCHSYADLQSDANRFANFLQARDVERGDRVVVSGTQCVEVLAAHVACWKLGAVSVPASVLLGPDALRHRLRDSDATAAVITPDAIDAFRAASDDVPALETVVAVDADPAEGEASFQDAVEGTATDREMVATAPTDPAIVLYTSGTTGDPKGVVLPHQHLLGVLPPVLCGVLNLAIDDDELARTPVEWSWAGSFVDLVLPMLFYGIPVLAADEGPFDPARELELLDAHDVTVTGGPPTLYRVTFGYPAVESTNLSRVRVLALGGEAASGGIVDRAREVLPNAAVHEVYGQSESPLVATDCEALGVPHRAGKMGKPAPGYDVGVVEADTCDGVERGEVGEIALRREGNPGCFTGYVNRNAASTGKVADGWQFTEDLGTVDAEGYLEFHSRADDVIVSAGHRIGPGEVEATLATHDAVANAGVIGVPDDTRGEVVKAFVVPTDGLDSTAERERELQEYVKRRLAKHEYPRELEFVTELPMTPTGKVRRHALRVREGVAD
jgi:acetyl-CoA synthetase